MTLSSSRIFTLIASMKITGYTGSSGRLCQSDLERLGKTAG